MSEVTRIFAKARIKYKNRTAEEWEAENPILLDGEFGFVSDVNENEWFKVGDGVTTWNDLPWKKGPQGEQGLRGEQGIQGEKGDKGDKGDAGQDYILTETDKNEIAGMTKPFVDEYLKTRIVEISAEEYEALEKDPDTYYFVY